MDFEIKIAHYSFSCPICGTLVRRGDAYCEDINGCAFYLCVMPAKKLVVMKNNEPEMSFKK